MYINFLKHGKERKNRKQRFDRIMIFADELIEENEVLKRAYKSTCSNHPIFNLIRLLGNSTKNNYMKQLVVEGTEPTIKESEVFFNMSAQVPDENMTFFELKEEVNFSGAIKLGRDIVLPWPWNRGRLLAGLCRYGTELYNSAWVEDSLNHSLELWLPIGISWVRGGNHSITTGIIQGEGTIHPKNVYDISKYYKYVSCDGVYYWDKINKQIISEVSNVEFAAIFEIGRLLVENKIEFNP